MNETKEEIRKQEKGLEFEKGVECEFTHEVLWMECPICTGSSFSDDFSVIKMPGTKVIIQGVIRAIDGDHQYSPFSDCFTVSIYSRKGRVKYLKFRTQDELNECDFSEGDRIR